MCFHFLSPPRSICITQITAFPWVLGVKKPGLTHSGTSAFLTVTSSSWEVFYIFLLSVRPPHTGPSCQSLHSELLKCQAFTPWCACGLVHRSEHPMLYRTKRFLGCHEHLILMRDTEDIRQRSSSSCFISMYPSK